jgi:serine/threonine protein kinase
LNQAQGLQDLIRTIQRLNLSHFPAAWIERGEAIGEGETFWVERCRIVGHGKHTIEKQTTGKQVAVKHLKVGRWDSESPEYRRRLNSLLLELRIMDHGPLKSHPNILTLIGYGWNADEGGILPYILVDYCANGNVRQYLTEKKASAINNGTERTLSPKLKEMLIADVAAGIDVLHTAGIIHGDVKLENVLVVDSDQRYDSPMAKLCDFGHSIIIGLEPDIQKPISYNGTRRYVHCQS